MSSVLPPDKAGARELGHEPRGEGTVALLGEVYAVVGEAHAPAGGVGKEDAEPLRRFPAEPREFPRRGDERPVRTQAPRDIAGGL